ncbi:uncharacterized protein DUF3995 [Archangium gephyra]|uniref:Uncharacterized protein DUF3995 n=1 Tax=Archangium gephyra TaxID=48 RepID=A0AAC8Q480_9BACT|nr:DUF3995 domain-containing protein [Archangium gephyra]AKJ00577.1 Hypothetical protein AA314_02203 [Archangium gephyra]REG32728.1 uncharacterized protein DUF3995 [Archangium gephyra]
MMMILGVAAAAVLGALSGLHFFWASGGRWGGSVVIPELDGKAAFTPTPLATGVVGVLLLGAAGVALTAAGVRVLPLPLEWVRAGTGLLSAAFFLRAVGDFRYVGLFKRHRRTRFAQMDDRLYLPLCLGLSAALAAVVLLPLP